MSLRYAFPINTSLVVDERELRRVPALREPKTITYNGVADADDFFSELDQLSYCKVVGKTGVGKSSVLPKLIAGRLKKTVLVVSPHPLLAVQGYEFFMTNSKFGYDGSDLRGELAEEGVDMNFDDYDIVWMSAVYLTSWLVSRREKTVQSGCLKDLIIFLDEAHESDAYTHVVRTVTPHFGIRALIMASATFEPCGHTISKDKVKVETFDAFDVPKTWDVFTPGKPWSEESIRTNALIYVDNHYDAVRLVEDYERAGLVAYRLHARSSVKEYVDAAADLDGTAIYRTVVIVDSSFRSGFNFDADLIIDSGIRYLANGTIGVQATYKRPIYNVEFVQTAGRGGRFGKKTTYYMPDVEPEWKICDLESVEAEGAAYLTRALGFQPIRPLHNTVLAYENFPEGVDVNQAFAGDKPLTCYLRDADLCRLPGVKVVGEAPVFTGTTSNRSTTGTLKPSDVGSRLTLRSLTRLDTLSRVSRSTRRHESVIDMFRDPPVSLHPTDSVSRVHERLRGTDTQEQELPAVVQDVPNIGNSVDIRSPDNVWKEVQETILKGIGVSVDLGAYLYSPDVSSANVISESKFFPEREKSLVQLSVEGGLNGYIHNLASKHVKFALYHCLRRHNLLNLEVNSVKRAMVSILNKKHDTIFDVALRRKFSAVIHKHVKWEMERDTMFRIISDLCSRRYSVATMKGFDLRETDRVDFYTKRFTVMIDKHQLRAPNVDDWIGHHRSSSGSNSDEIFGRSRHRSTIGGTKARKAIEHHRSSSSQDSEKTNASSIKVELETASSVRTFTSAAFSKLLGD